MKSKSFILFVVLICITSPLFTENTIVALQSGPDPWLMQGHDARRTERSSAAGPLTTHIKWTYDLNARVQDNASPIVGADGTIYIPSETDFFAINPDGTLKWKKYYVLRMIFPAAMLP